MTRKPRKWWVPFTYTPKIPFVQSGECHQTIRIGLKYIVGDEIAFHGWAGVPRRSPWSWRTPFWPLKGVGDMMIFPTGIKTEIDPGIVPWSHPLCDLIAKLDYIDPPTGEELGRILNALNRIPLTGIDAQVLTWDPGLVA